jgi:hypothetical protein
MTNGKEGLERAQKKPYGSVAFRQRRFESYKIAKPSDFVAPIGAGLDMQSILLSVPAAPEPDIRAPQAIA